MLNSRFSEVRYFRKPVKGPFYEPIKGSNYDIPRSRKPVTIAAGFRFNEGLLLCADTQYTANHKTDESKIFHVRHGGASIVLILTGSEGFGKRAVELVSKEVRNVSVGELTKEGVLTSVRG